MQTPTSGYLRPHSARTPATPATRERRRKRLHLELTTNSPSPTGPVDTRTPLIDADVEDDVIDNTDIQRRLFQDEFGYDDRDYEDLFSPAPVDEATNDMINVDGEGAGLAPSSSPEIPLAQLMQWRQPSSSPEVPLAQLLQQRQPSSSPEIPTLCQKATFQKLGRLQKSHRKLLPH